MFHMHLFLLSHTFPIPNTFIPSLSYLSISKYIYSFSISIPNNTFAPCFSNPYTACYTKAPKRTVARLLNKCYISIQVYVIYIQSLSETLHSATCSLIRKNNVDQLSKECPSSKKNHSYCIIKRLFLSTV